MNLNSNYSLIVYRRKCPNYRGSGNYSIIGIAILPANKKILNFKNKLATGLK